MRDLAIQSYNKIVQTISSSTNDVHIQACISMIEQFSKEYCQPLEQVNDVLYRDLQVLVAEKGNEIEHMEMPELAKFAVLSLSGGMDSTCLLIRLLKEGKRVKAVSFNYGQKHSIELQKAVSNIAYLNSMGYIVEHVIVDLTSAMESFHSALTTEGMEIPEGHYESENMKLTVVPNRNAIFAAIIYGHALSLSTKYQDNEGKKRVDISLGTHSGDHLIYPDCKPEFQTQLEKAFKLGNWDSNLVSYYTPYIRGNKTTILEDCWKNCQELEIDFDTVLSNTITSYNPDSQGRSSGRSGSDVERIEAFLNIGRIDPITYQEPWSVIVENAKKTLNRS